MAKDPRVSRDSQTTENQRIVPVKLAERSGFTIVESGTGPWANAHPPLADRQVDGDGSLPIPRRR
jgi:hypothetical protein